MSTARRCGGPARMDRPGPFLGDEPWPDAPAGWESIFSLPEYGSLSASLLSINTLISAERRKSRLQTVPCRQHKWVRAMWRLRGPSPSVLTPQSHRFHMVGARRDRSDTSKATCLIRVRGTWVVNITDVDDKLIPAA